MPAEIVVITGIFGGVTLSSPKSSALGAVTAKTPTGARAHRESWGKAAR